MRFSVLRFWVYGFISLIRAFGSIRGAAWGLGRGTELGGVEGLERQGSGVGRTHFS